jgi:hypothetical protein
MSTGILSSVNLIAGAGILGNVGGFPIAANADLGNAISSYTSVNVVARFLAIASSGYVDQNIVADTFPALTDAVPTAYQSVLGNATMTATIEYLNNNILGNGDLGKFEQVFSSAQAFVSQNNQLIKTTLNANALTNTTGFSGQDNLSTGGISSVSQAFSAFGADLAQLGFLIDLGNLNNLGNPDAVLKQIVAVSSSTPALNTALLNVGIPASAVDNISSTTFTDQQQHLIYLAMTQITGSDLQQILHLLRVTTPNITTMADLLNPVKIFPRSFQTLTAPTANGLRGIYINSAGAVNSRLTTELPASVLAPLTGNPLQNMPNQIT